MPPGKLTTQSKLIVHRLKMLYAQLLGKQLITTTTFNHLVNIYKKKKINTITSQPLIFPSHEEVAILF